VDKLPSKLFYLYYCYLTAPFLCQFVTPEVFSLLLSLVILPQSLPLLFACINVFLPSLLPIGIKKYAELLPGLAYLTLRTQYPLLFINTWSKFRNCPFFKPSFTWYLGFMCWSPR